MPFVNVMTYCYAWSTVEVYCPIGRGEDYWERLLESGRMMRGLLKIRPVGVPPGPFLLGFRKCWQRGFFLALAFVPIGDFVAAVQSCLV